MGMTQVQWTPAHEEIRASFWQANFFDPSTWDASSGFPYPEFGGQRHEIGRQKIDPFFRLGPIGMLSRPVP
jgi:hypothetical protein